MFSTLPKTNFNILVTFILASANVSILDQSEKLSFGKDNILEFKSKSVDHIFSISRKYDLIVIISSL